jgi:hypothetical protein
MLVYFLFRANEAIAASTSCTATRQRGQPSRVRPFYHNGFTAAVLIGDY